MDRPLHILLVDDEDIVHQTIGDYLRHAGHHVARAETGEQALRTLETADHDLALVDIRLPGLGGLDLLERIQARRPDVSVVMISGHGTMDTVIEVLRRGAVDYLKKPIKLPELDAVIEKAARFHDLQRRHRHLAETIEDLQAAPEHPALIGDSPSTRRVRDEIHRAVDAQCNTLLLDGETGTGKEVVAHQIHRLAAGTDKPFIPVCCPALVETLAESELFGHVRGAFTGATATHPGHFELAHGGTLFLDEVADLSPTVQAKLLRVLETRTLRPVGATREIAVELRVIAATNVPLQERLASGAFRQDLFYRLNLYHIHLDPLRDRTQDIIPLAHHFLRASTARRHLTIPGFTDDARDALLAHTYPGNVRELRNIIERAVILARDATIDTQHLTITHPAHPQPHTPHTPDTDHQEAQNIRNALEQTRWNRRQAAQILGIPYSTLRYKITRLGIH